MVTLQEYLNQKYPSQEDKAKVKEINIDEVRKDRFLGVGNELKRGGRLDLRGFKNIEKVEIENNDLTNINISSCDKLRHLSLSNNNLTSIDFLDDLPCPEKLECLSIYSNNIKPTKIKFFSKFFNLARLSLGTIRGDLNRGKRNYFYGSLRSYKDLTKLGGICIEATDVSEGLEYLPMGLAQNTNKNAKYPKPYNWEYNFAYQNIECSPHGLDVGCKKIQDQLRPFNYDLLAWQLAHPEKMLIARPELFTNPNSKDGWLTALESKIKHSQETLDYIIQNESDKTAKIKRLKSQIEILQKKLEEEREIHREAMKTMDNWYQRLITKKETREIGTQTEPVKTQDQQTQTEEFTEYVMPGSWPNKK